MVMYYREGWTSQSRNKSERVFRGTKGKYLELRERGRLRIGI